MNKHMSFSIDSLEIDYHLNMHTRDLKVREEDAHSKFDHTPYMQYSCGV